VDIKDIPCPNCNRHSLSVRGFERPTILCRNDFDGIERQSCYGKFIINDSIDETVKLIEEELNSEYRQKKMTYKEMLVPSVCHGELDFY
jgi:hypothetical protein